MTPEMHQESKPLRGLRFLVMRILPVVSGALLLTMVAVTVVDVIGRYFFNAPLPGAYELTQVLLADLVLAALPITTYKGSHVEVDILSQTWSDRTERIISVFGATVTALTLFVMSWTVAGHGQELLHDGGATYDLGIPYWPTAFLGALTFVISGVIALVPASKIREI